MADHAGVLLDAAWHQTDALNPAFDDRVVADATAGYLGALPIFGAWAAAGPLAELARARTGHHMRSWGFLHWYDHLHVTPQVLSLGNVISNQERSLSVWNGYLVPQQLTATAVTGDDAITVDEPVTAPHEFAPLEEQTYLVGVAAEGAPTITGLISFLFTLRTIDVVVTGVRVVAWQWEPNWINPVIETLRWKTDVQRSYDGHEQRRQLRGAPRQAWSFTFDARERSRRRLENVLQSWGARIWALPLWPDVIEIDADANAGQLQVSADTGGRDFRAGGLAILLSGDTVEAVEIDTVDPSGLTLARPLVNDWPTGSRLFPARTARLEQHPTLARMTWNHERAAVRFRSVDEVSGAAATETLYRDQPVAEDTTNWRDLPELTYLRKVAELTMGTGRDAIVDEAETALPVQSVLWTALTRDDAATLRAFLYARRGRARAVWVPTWNEDLRLVDTVGPAVSTIDVEECGLVYFATNEIMRRDVRIELTDGTVYFRRLTDFATVDETTERASMNAPFGQTVTPDDVLRISWLHLMRLDHDDVDLVWHTPAVTEARLILAGYRHDG